MAAIHETGIYELLPVCSESCSCATCHIYVKGEHAYLLPPVGSDNDDLLGGGEFQTGLARLSFRLVC